MNQGLDTTGNKKTFQPMALLEGKVDFYGYIMLHIYVDCRLYDVFVLSIINITFTFRRFFIGILDWKPYTLGVDRQTIRRYVNFVETGQVFFKSSANDGG